MKTNWPDSGEQQATTRSVPATIQRDPLVPRGSDGRKAHGPNGSRMSRIAERAHEIYMNRGGDDGKALDDWLQAEREIDADD